MLMLLYRIFSYTDHFFFAFDTPMTAPAITAATAAPIAIGTVGEVPALLSVSATGASEVAVSVTVCDIAAFVSAGASVCADSSVCSVSTASEAGTKSFAASELSNIISAESSVTEFSFIVRIT